MAALTYWDGWTMPKCAAAACLRSKPTTFSNAHIASQRCHVRLLLFFALKQVIIQQDEHANGKGNEREVLAFQTMPHRNGIKAKKFGKHPQRVCTDPKGNGQVVRQL